jgi:hypothetical protein
MWSISQVDDSIRIIHGRNGGAVAHEMRRIVLAGKSTKRGLHPTSMNGQKGGCKCNNCACRPQRPHLGCSQRPTQAASGGLRCNLCDWPGRGPSSDRITRHLALLPKAREAFAGLVLLTETGGALRPGSPACPRRPRRATVSGPRT